MMTELSPLAVLLVLGGSALGGMARHAVSTLVAEGIHERFPWGILTVNVSGAFLIGIVVGSVWSLPLTESAEIILYLGVVGFLGSYTTVSTFSLQTMRLALDRQWGRAVGNIGLSMGLCLAAAWLGFGLVSAAI